jgi:hypothetical protein
MSYNENQPYETKGFPMKNLINFVDSKINRYREVVEYIECPDGTIVKKITFPHVKF